MLIRSFAALGSGSTQSLHVAENTRNKLPHRARLTEQHPHKVGVPQGGPFSPLAANIYLNEVDWFFDATRRKTQGEPTRP
jgi:hypothetical protein